MAAAGLSPNLAIERPCFYAPDLIYFLRPKMRLTMSVGPRLAINVTDTVNQTLAATTTASVGFNANTIVAGTWPALQTDQALLIESLSGQIIAQDALGKLVVVNAGISLDSVYRVPINLNNGLPYTFALMNADTFTWIAFGPYLSVPTPGTNNAALTGNGPNVNVVLSNPDAAAHPYRRHYSMAYRIVMDCDFSSGPSIPGAGLGGVV